MTASRSLRLAVGLLLGLAVSGCELGGDLYEVRMEMRDFSYPQVSAEEQEAFVAEYRGSNGDGRMCMRGGLTDGWKTIVRNVAEADFADRCPQEVTADDDDQLIFTLLCKGEGIDGPVGAGTTLSIATRAQSEGDGFAAEIKYEQSQSQVPDTIAYTLVVTGERNDACED